MTGKRFGWIKQINTKGNEIIAKLDNLPLWWVGFVLLAIVLVPNLILGEGSVFTVHDQLDESMMNYVLTARHPGEGTLPEMLGGINASGLAPSAVLFSLLYRVMTPFHAFLCTYALLIVCGFLGMYFAVRELSESSILAALCAGIFCMLPLYPVYGLSQMGIPLILYAFLCLWKKKHIPLALALTVLFGLTSHLVYTGYAVLGLWFLALLAAMVSNCGGQGRGRLRRGGTDSDASDSGVSDSDSPVGGLPQSRGRRFGKWHRAKTWCDVGFVLLLLTYVLTNLNLIAEILFGRTLDGQPCYVSHREEMVNSAMPFWRTVRDVFTGSAQHAPAYHEKLILPIFLLLILGGVFYKRLNDRARKQYHLALCGMLVLVLIALFYGVCKSGPVVDWKNSVTGFLHYFQMERFYWLYPAGWYLELALSFSVWWTAGRKQRVLQCLVLALVILPTADTVLHNSYFYMNVNQKNNGSGITGYISWESYYAEELMGQIEDAIGRDMSTYRVGHLGISPAPSLMHGFYTVDGYSNNYPLSYKHAFRRVIAAELEMAPETAVYFDKWGNRCYLFNSQTGNYWMLEKGSGVVYQGLQFDMAALTELGCEYLFSGGEIADADRMGLRSRGYFETEDSYWGIWLYELTE